MNHSDLNRNAHMLTGPMAKRGYMRWWHSFQGKNIANGEIRTFFVEYFIVNPSLGSDRPIFPGQMSESYDGRPSYVCVKAGIFPKDGLPGKQLNQYYPLTSLRVADRPFYLSIEDCALSEHHISGFVDISENESKYAKYYNSDAGTMEWDLKVCKSIACHTGAISSKISGALNLLSSFWHGEGIKTDYSGTVILDDQIFQITPKESYGYADKHWGRNFNQPWLQLSSCKLLSERTGKYLKYSALAVNGCSPRLFGITLRTKLMIQLTYTGEDYCFSFARLGCLSRIKWLKKETNRRFIWHAKAQNQKNMVKLSMHCKKHNILPLHYDSPLGLRSKKPVLASGCGLGTLELYRVTDDGLQWIDTLHIEDALCAYQTRIS